MKLREIKEWIESLPEGFLEFEVMNSEEGSLMNEYSYRLDKPLIELNVDEDTQEILFLNKETKKPQMENKVFKFGEFVNENYVEPTEEVNEDGYGSSPFFVAKAGDALNYFFKVDAEEAHKSVVLTIGKFAKFAQPTEAKGEYGVLSLMELPEEQLDQAVVDKGKFEANAHEFTVTEREINKIFEIVASCVSDYLQKNPKVIKFYNEMQATVRNPEYDKRLLLSLEKWPGGTGVWHMQEVEKNKINIIMK